MRHLIPPAWLGLASLLLFALALGCGGEAPIDPDPESLPGSGSAQAPDGSSGPTLPRGRALWVDNERPEPLALRLGDSRWTIPPYHVQRIEVAPGTYELEGQPFRVDAGRHLLVYNPGRRGVYEYQRATYAVGGGGGTTVVETIRDQLLFSRLAQHGLDKALPFVVGDGEAIRFRIRKVLGDDISSIEQALAIATLPRAVFDDRARRRAWSLIDASDDFRVRDLFLRQLAAAKPSSAPHDLIKRVLRFYPESREEILAVVEAFPANSQVRRQIGFAIERRDLELLKQRLRGGGTNADLEQLMKRPKLLAGLGSMVSATLRQELDASGRAIVVAGFRACADDADRARIADFFLATRRGAFAPACLHADLAPLALWAFARRGRGYRWFTAMARAGDAVALSVVDAWDGAGEPPKQIGKVLAILAARSDAALARGAVTAMTGVAARLPEARQMAVLYDIGVALTHSRHREARSAGYTALADFAVGLLSSEVKTVREWAFRYACDATRVTRARTWLARLEAAAAREADAPLARSMASRLRYVKATLGG